MSKESREHMETAKENIKQAEKHLQNASEHAQKGGDGGMSQKIEKLKTDTGTVRQDLERKLGGSQSGQ